jgi:hypothetical protein
VTLDADERMTMTRQYLVETDLDAETRGKIHCIAFVLEHDARESGDPDADDVYIAACWSLSRPENLGAVDDLYADAGPLAREILVELEEGALGWPMDSGRGSGVNPTLVEGRVEVRDHDEPSNRRPGS